MSADWVCSRCGSDAERMFMGNGCDRCTPERVRGAFDAARVLGEVEFIEHDESGFYCPSCGAFELDREKLMPFPHAANCKLHAALVASGVR